MNKLIAIALGAAMALSFTGCGDDDEEGGSENSGYNGDYEGSIVAVDLGLSVKWANCNLGATKPESYGDYYTWGETETKKVCSPDNYKFRFKGGRGAVLDSDNDAARVNLGGSWRMPTVEEWEELATNCTWTETKINGVAGYKVSSKRKTGKWIFLPAAGAKNLSTFEYRGESADYWLATFGVGDPLEGSVYEDGEPESLNCSAYIGLPIRPVSD